ncbi:MAG: restriction endonuclease subunit S [Candidatus Omnitrophota bacterium]|nr:restriction endonuclease subunit S [Candidatus Omnitrophota bacterium]
MKRYPVYKNSGIEWIGKVPQDWQVNRLKTVCTFTYGDSLADEDRIEGGIPVYGSNGIVGYHNKAITHKPCIIIGRKGSYGKVNFSQTECFPIDTTYFVDDRSAKCDLKWLSYVLPLLELDKFSKDTGVPGLNREDAHDKRVPIPESEVKKVITDYLNRKTAQIDDLIAKKERMIELLKEERTVIINQAVTKGLNPKAEMKESGIEWLGRVPKHWRLKRLKYVVNINPVRPNTISEESKVIFIAMESMSTDGTYDNSVMRSYLEVKTGFTYFAEDDVIFAKITPCFENGKGALLRNLGSAIGFGSTEFHVLRSVRNETIPEYLYFLTISGLFRRLGEAFMQGVAGQKRVTNDFVQNFLIGVPPIDEQEAISSFLADKIRKIDAQVAREQKSIELLKEYRTSLISEVVTGKICLCE